MTDYLTTQQAADILGEDSSAVRRLCIVGVLTAEKFGHMWRIKHDDTFTTYAANPRRNQGRGRPRHDVTSVTTQEDSDNE